MSRHSGAREASRLHIRLEALNDARELAGGVLPDEALDEVLGVLERASSRRSLSSDHTVVGFFGATGSGKSSLFNAVHGEEIATAAARRLTTSEPLASVWGADGSEPLLDWLGVGKRHHAAAVPGFADETTGLILLDLPDFDSTKAANREIVQRMVGMVDVLVWVLDPQKYADAAVHNDFITPLATHGAVTLVVLNQIDRLPPPGRGAGSGVAQRHSCQGRLGAGPGHGRVGRGGNGCGESPRGNPQGGSAAAGAVPAAGCGCFQGVRAARGGVRNRGGCRSRGRHAVTPGRGACGCR